MLLQEAEKGKKKEKKTNNTRVKLMKTSQNMALLWLIQLSWLVPKHRRLLQAWLSTLIELDFCVNCLKAAVLHPHISWVYSRKLSDLFCSLPGAWKMTCKHGGKAFFSQYRLTFKQMSSKLVNTSCRGSGLGASLLHNNSLEISTDPWGWIASHLNLLT